MLVLLAAAALSLYALAETAAAGAEIERYSRTREALNAVEQALEEGNAALREQLRIERG